MLLNSFIDIFKLFLPLIVVCVCVGIVLGLGHWKLIRHPGNFGKKRQFSNQLIMLGLTLVSIVAIALALPVADSVRNQVVALIGLAISGVLAFSSSTIFANLMAGIMLRVTKPFYTGDFIQVADYFGRVSERGLLDTEIQSEQRELVAIPNTFLITNPVSVVRSSGTVVSTTLSLGYDIHHSRIESLLKQAAENAGLDEPFVQLIELGDYAVTYKINGMLAEVKSLLTARSNLRREVLDMLHGGGIEIVSPSFMNQRSVTDNGPVIPVKTISKPKPDESVVEELIFDKAEEAEQANKEKLLLLAALEELQLAKKSASDDDKVEIKERIEQAQLQLKALEQAPSESN